MPNLDGTGPLGQGSIRGSRRGAPRGRKLRQTGTKECICPKCDYKESYTRGTPCTEKKCPECGTTLKGIYCS